MRAVIRVLLRVRKSISVAGTNGLQMALFALESYTPVQLDGHPLKGDAAATTQAIKSSIKIVYKAKL